MNQQVLFIIFLFLMTNELLGTAAFLAIFLMSSDWRQNAVGRHLVYYSSGLVCIYITTFLSFFIKHNWLLYLIICFHILWSIAIWQRVVLVAKAVRQDRKRIKEEQS